ncbi:uncharacterized protein LOC102955708 [Panthera tigris]|uniref:uncharacterized protein LOC102955708 n=1 Tax=Panthera tigris TaxID=9694 RepID=UPI001C6FA0A0|nr:uncharacterized protein LOC102955708 [Panthera tigris]
MAKSSQSGSWRRGAPEPRANLQGCGLRALGEATEAAPAPILPRPWRGWGRLRPIGIREGGGTSLSNFLTPFLSLLEEKFRTSAAGPAEEEHTAFNFPAVGRCFTTQIPVPGNNHTHLNSGNIPQPLRNKVFCGSMHWKISTCWQRDAWGKASSGKQVMRLSQKYKEVDQKNKRLAQVTQLGSSSIRGGGHMMVNQEDAGWILYGLGVGTSKRIHRLLLATEDVGARTWRTCLMFSPHSFFVDAKYSEFTVAMIFQTLKKSFKEPIAMDNSRVTHSTSREQIHVKWRMEEIS